MKLSTNKQRMVTARLEAAGIPVLVEDNSVARPDLVVESLKGSRVFDLKMGSECVLNVMISNNSYANLRIDKLQGRLLEGDWWWAFQGDPKEHAPERKTYRMLSGRRFPYDSILNHRLRGEIAAGSSMRGMLLALSVSEKIPVEYTHGLLVPLEVILVDQYGRQHASIIATSVDRSATMPKPRAFTRVDGGLYGGSPLEIPVFDHRPPSQDLTGSANVRKAEELPEVVKWIKEFMAMEDLDAMLDRMDPDPK